MNQISFTALSAINRYGDEWDDKTTFKNKYYQIEKFSVSNNYGGSSYLTIDALDGRGEILNYPSNPNARHPETQAKAKFNQEDVELFSTIVKQIEQKRREAERTRLLEQSQQRQRGRGLSL